MNSLNFKVIKTVCEWLEQGERVFFVTVLNTWGASPRPVGSLFAFNVDKVKQVGSLSGGCVEEDLIQFLAKKALVLKQEKDTSDKYNNQKSPLYFLKLYGDKDGDRERYLLPCGGTLELLIEPLFDKCQYDHFLKIQTYLTAHKPIARVVNFLNSELSYALAVDKKIHNKSQVLVFNHDAPQLFHRLDPMYQLLIVGAGDVAYYVTKLANSLDFTVTICEPRKEYAERLISLDDTEIHYCLPDDLIRTTFSESNTAIICLAHDPKVDDMALIEALTNTKAFYVGAMGSMKTTENRMRRLKALGLEESQIARLHAPIGIDIHSKTPQEIAISIIAELISVRYKVNSQYYP